MKNILKYLSFAAGGVLLLSISFATRAMPVLQLDIIGGTYDNGTQTIVTTDDSFTLVAYGKVGSISLGDYFYISAAVTPKIGPAVPAGGIGSFDVDALAYNGADGTYDISDMVYGVPPIESFATQSHDAGDLQHDGDIFETFFTELMFEFNSGQRTANVNTQDNPGTTPVNDLNGDLYYQLFDIDISGLLEDFNLHFDLYNEEIITCSNNNPNCVAGDVDRDLFAPFSHDAETRTSVSEPAPLTLMGMGLLALMVTARKQYSGV